MNTKGKKALSAALTVALVFGLFTFVQFPANAGNEAYPQFSGGYAHTAAISEDGTLWTWGFNENGQLGDGTATDKAEPVKIAAGTKFAQVSAGFRYTAAIDADGNIWTWGANYYGELGDGTTESKNAPKKINTEKKFAQISAGWSHTAAIDVEGSLWTWGQNDFGELGDRTSENKTTPAKIMPDIKFAQVAAGGGFTMAIDIDGNLWAWGNSEYGQLGDDMTENTSEPKRIMPDIKFAQVSAGTDHTAAIDIDGNLWTWGRNNFGQIGDGGETEIVMFPKPIMSETKFAQVSAGGSFTMALDREGNLWGWGKNVHGEIGNGTTTYNARGEEPQQVKPGTKFARVAAGNAHTMAVDNDGSIWAWGMNYTGELGDGTKTDRNVPVKINAKIDPASAVFDKSQEKDTSIAVKSNVYILKNIKNENYTLKANTDFSIDANGNVTLKKEYLKTLEARDYMVIFEFSGGDGAILDLTVKNAPLPADDGTYPQISAGVGHSMAFDGEGRLWSWGYNEYGQLGDGTNTHRSKPTQIASKTKFAQVSAGGWHTVAIAEDGNLWTWGSNVDGQLGDGTTRDRSEPKQITISGKPGTKFTQISTGYAHTVALAEDGSIWAWGWNSRGQIGDGTTTRRNEPTEIKAGTKFARVLAGGLNTMAIAEDGSFWIWGCNEHGQLGDGTNEDKSAPVKIDYGTKFLQVSGGGYHMAAIAEDGSLWAWGYNVFGQLGDGTTIDKNKPVQIKSRTTFKKVSAGGYHTAALDSEGNLWVWGENYCGQLGDGTNTQKTAPVQIKTGTKFTQVSAGEYHTMAIDTEGNLWVWGKNEYGRIGDGTITDRNIPVKVLFSKEKGANPAIEPTEAKFEKGSGKDIAVTMKPDGCTLQTIKNGGVLLVKDKDYKIDGDKVTLTVGYLEELDPKIHTITFEFDGGEPQTLDFKLTVSVSSTGDETYVQVSAGYAHTMAIDKNGSLWAWGNNELGQLGDGTNEDKTEPTKIKAGTKFAQVATGNGYTMAIANDGSLWAWGHNDYGQLGDGTNTHKNEPTKIKAGTKFSQVAAGIRHTAAIADDGNLWAWGHNEFGQLGDGTNTHKNEPKQIVSEAKFAQVSAGYWHTVAIDREGNLWTWGDNAFGQLGDGMNENKNEPKQIVSETKFAQVSAGYWHTVAIAQDGSLRTWGRNDYGQLGDDTTTDRNIPVKVVTGTSITPPRPFPFGDVSENEWYYEDVKTAYESGLINGKSDNSFAPNDYLTYAEAVKLAACMHQLYTTGKVTLEPGAGAEWHSTYVSYAKANNIIAKDYEWNKNATRAGYMEIFASALPDEALAAINTVPDGSIPDVPMTHEQAGAIYKLYRAGIVQGVDSAAHACIPESNIKRSEVAAILTRMMNPDKRIRFTMA